MQQAKMPSLTKYQHSSYQHNERTDYVDEVADAVLYVNETSNVSAREETTAQRCYM